MRACLKPRDTAIDVGANIGDLTLPLAAAVGDAGKVYAFESHPEVFKVLCANLALNNVQNTLPVNAFVAADSNANTASSTWGEFAYVGARWPTRFVAIDDLELERLALIKVDVDGNELQVLQSGAMHIETYRPVLYFENDLREKSSPFLAYVLEHLGYDLYWHPAPIFEPENYYGNSVNHWAPDNVISLMMLGFPREIGATMPSLRKVSGADDWWDRA
jgi:FkbM family methyltransferase